MKFVVHIIIILCSALSYGQVWRDSLDMARDAYKNEEYSKALEYYESAQKHAPEEVDLSDEMAQSAYKARKFEKAEEIYQQSTANKTSRTAQADNYHNIGNARMKQNDYEGAVEAYKEAVRLNPNDDQTRYNLSEAIRQLKDQQKKNNKGGGNNNNNSNNNNQNNKNQQGGQKNQGGNEQQNSSGNEKSNSKNQSGSGQEGKLKNKTVDRMLDKLMKDEAETKRKMYGTKGHNSTPRSGKDW